MLMWSKWDTISDILTELYNENIIYILDVVGRKWQEKSWFNFVHRDDIDALHWRNQKSEKIILSTIAENELMVLYHQLLKTPYKEKSKVFEAETNLRTRMKTYSNKYTPDDLDKIKSEVSIVDLVRSYSGENRWKPWSLIKCPLPDHKDGTSSFSMNHQRWLFKCFGCQNWWSQIDFIMKMENCWVSDAIKRLKTFL